MKRLFAGLLVVLVIAIFARCAEAQAPKPQTPSTTNDAERPKNAVELAMEEAKSRGEVVLGTCVDDCEEFDRVNGERLERGRAVELVKPEYPRLARHAKAAGEIVVQVLIDSDGKVIAASALSGHPLLFATCVKAARETVFTQTKYDGKPVKVVGEIKYNFVGQ